LEWSGVGNLNNDLQIFAGLNISAKRNMIGFAKFDNNYQANVQLESIKNVQASANGRLRGVNLNNFTVSLQKASINIGDGSDSKGIQISSGSKLAVDVPMGGYTGLIAINASAVDSNNLPLFNTIDAFAWDVTNINQYLNLAILSRFKGGKGGSTSWNAKEQLTYGQPAPSGKTMDIIIFMIISQFEV
jgi:hypothetical protein